MGAPREVFLKAYDTRFSFTVGKVSPGLVYLENCLKNVNFKPAELIENQDSKCSLFHLILEHLKQPGSSGGPGFYGWICSEPSSLRV